MHWWRQKINIVVLFIILLQISGRLAMSLALEHYVKRVLNTLPGYKAELHGVSISVFSVSYRIDSLRIYKPNRREKPLIEVPEVKISPDWEGLFRGRIASKISFEKPVLNITVDEPSNLYSIQSWISGFHWEERVQRLLMLEVNHLSIKDGELNFYDRMPDQPVHLFMRSLQMEATDLAHSINENDLQASKIFIQGTTMGEGRFTLAANISGQKNRPDLDVDLKLEHVNISALKHFFRVYTQTDIHHGDLNVYSEIAVLNGQIDGYVRPQFSGLMAQNARLVASTSEDTKLTARFPVEGRVSNLRTMYWPGVWNAFSKSFAEACKKSTGEAISFGRKRPIRMEKIWFDRERSFDERRMTR